MLLLLFWNLNGWLDNITEIIKARAYFVHLPFCCCRYCSGMGVISRCNENEKKVGVPCIAHPFVAVVILKCRYNEKKKEEKNATAP